MTKALAEKKNRLLTLLALLSLLNYVFVPLARASEFVITDNGSDSDSSVKVTINSQTDISQTNDADVGNNVDINANTGENSASGNTSGETTISTGDTNIQVDLENSGNVSIISQPDCCQESTSAQISGNGSDSTNQINTTSTSTTNVNIYQNATITNSISGYINTGKNEASDNTGGNVEVTTGNIKVQGEIINGPVNYSKVEVASELSSFAAKIVNNGSNSENLINSHFDDPVSIDINNISEIDNYISWDLNTGKNSADNNTGGNVKISTGDISLDVFIKNFVNIGGVDIDCCFDLGRQKDEEPKAEEPKAEEPQEEQDEGSPENVAVDGGGQILPEAAAVSAGGPGIIGLSDTSSDKAQVLFFWLALSLIAIGGKIVVDELFPKNALSASIKKSIK